jgi:hypothetical protein
MSTTMNNVIRKTESSVKPTASEQKLVIIDKKKKEIKKPVFGTSLFLGGDVQHYLVSNNTDPDNLAEYKGLSVEVKDFHRDRKIGLSLSYIASCNSGNEESLALSLSGDLDPRDELHKKINNWVATFTRGSAGTQFIDDFLNEIPKLEEYVKEEAQNIGLFMKEIRITPDRNPVYYLIKNIKDTSKIAEQNNLNVLLNDKSKSREIGILISYTAGFFREDQDKVFKVLCANEYADESITATIDAKLKDWALRFIDIQGVSSFIENYSTELPKLRSALEKKAREEAGLLLEMVVELDRNPVRYIISTTANPNNIASCANLKIPLIDEQGDRRVNLLLNYRAGYDPINEETFANAFKGSKSIKDEIDKRIETWINSYLNKSKARFIDGYSKEEVETLIREIQDQAQKICLDLDLNISLENESKLESFKFGSEKTPIAIPIYTGGCEDELELRFWLKLEVSGSRINAVMRSLPSEKINIYEAVKKEIINFFRDQVSIKDFCHDLNGKVRERFITHLNHFLAYYGRKSEDLFFDSDTYFPDGKSIEIGTNETPSIIQVHVSDSDEQLELLVHTMLVLDDDNLAKGAFYSLPSKEYSLRNALERSIKEFLNTKVRIQDFSSNLKGKVRDNLFTYLNEEFPKRYGYRTGFLNLGTNLKFLPPEIVEVSCILECRVDGYSEKVSIENTVQMLPVDIAKYTQMIPLNTSQVDIKSSPIYDWVSSRLETIVKPLILQRKYIDLLTKSELDAIAESIKIAMEKEASSIGFSIKHIVSAPALLHLELKEDFLLEEEREYLTNDTRVKVKLKTSITAKFNDFHGIEQYLNFPIAKIKEKLQDTIDQVMGDYLSDVEPDRYYRYFHQSEGNSPAMRKQLEAAIQSSLETKYGMDISKVVVRTVETDISVLFEELNGKVEDFEFTIDSLSGGESVRFQARFQVESVLEDSWHTFYSRMGLMQKSQEPRRKEFKRLENNHERLAQSSELEDADELQKLREQMEIIKREVSGIEFIKKSITSSIEQMLSTFDSDASTYTDFANLLALQVEMNRWAKQSVKNEYGLEISIRNVRRNRLESDQELSEAQKALKLNRIKDIKRLEDERRDVNFKMLQAKGKSQLEELEKLRRNLMTVEDEDEILQLNKRISRLENEISLTESRTAEEQLKSLESKSHTKAKSFLDAQSQLNAAKNNDQDDT